MEGRDGGVRRDGGGEGRRGCSEGAQKVSGPAACMTSRSIGKVGAPGAVRLSAPCWTAPLICPLTIEYHHQPQNQPTQHPPWIGGQGCIETGFLGRLSHNTIHPGSLANGRVVLSS